MVVLEIQTSVREQMLDVTRMVGQAVQDSGIDDGWALVYCPHTTAAVTVNENADPDVPADVLDALQQLCPRVWSWRHREGNADAHAKAVLVGESSTIPVSGGSLALGTWQGIFFCEFDGPRTRTLIVTAIRE